MNAIDTIEKQVSEIRDGSHESVEPGQPVLLSEAASVSDHVRQGDLYLIVSDSIPDGYDKIEPMVQLVPGNTQGSRHCLDGLSGVEMYLHKDWSQSYDGTDGPVMVLSEERKVLHPTHGDVTIPAGMTVKCFYQREWDAEQRRERRNAD